MRKVQRLQRTLSSAAVFILLIPILACSGPDLPAQLSGTWQSSRGGTVLIDLVHTPAVVTVDGKSYTANVARIDDGSRNVHLAVQRDDGQTEEWILHQAWSDNGSDFTLHFTHNGTREDLVTRKSS